MPGVQQQQSDGAAVGVGSPLRKKRLSLKFLQRKETKRALDFTEPQAEEVNTAVPAATTSCDQVVPAPCPSSLPCGKRESLVPFVGLNNLGNTCYLNSILQVLYYCPGFKDAVKSLYQLSKVKDKQKEDGAKSEEGDSCEDSMPVHMELLHSFHSLICSVEQLQSSFLFNPDKYNEGELATPPRRILNTLRQLNPMYEGYLQHDAQEVLQCILGYIQEACDTIKKDLRTTQDEKPGETERITRGGTTDGTSLTQEEEESSDGQLSGKRKSDTEVGNAKKKPKSQSKPTKNDEEIGPFTRSKRKSSGDVAGNSVRGQRDVAEKEEKERGSNTEEEKSEGTIKEASKRKKRARLNWLKPSGKQPSIFSKFRSMGRISSHVGDKAESKDQDMSSSDPQGQGKATPESTIQNQTAAKTEEVQGLDMLKQLFQGQLVLRTRCLECECYTERREDFQDISVPVQENETSCSEASSEISPDPKPEQKTLKWAISQFASVERIVGQDKYFCETCHHYTEAERSLLFDKTPDVVTIHLKCFAASGSEVDPYAGLSKVNTPLLTPLKLSLDEWSTQPNTSHQEQHYRLFAVVMHSGVTISSGHYTTYIRMMDLHRTKLELQSPEESPREKDGEMKPLKEEGSPPDYDDGEVSFSLSSKVKNTTTGTSLTSKAGGKRSTEGVSLLGGQRSISSYEISTSKQAASEKPANMAAYTGSPAQNGVVKKERDERDGVKEESQVSLDMASQNLLDYEGKWMLFDDSEVRLFEEEEFVRACSPRTCSASTPYLLFYKKVSGEMN
ncbi:ubiquitin carboxyl-terminal hydrolase 1 isoform X2 [Neoarius graeffei]|uniref:ubiquitin carboxyl-terminal hydrolase 1 isoform X2 n=1 Tax=Neoarius graeffei TaxID=443677 RepID=UPI00298D1876|nr:ubiquitin carboxyl-terminal hydrolase 1 isoform X2 [Neoarius graeffei]